MRGQDITVLIMCVLMLAAFLFVRRLGRRDAEAARRERDEEQAR